VGTKDNPPLILQYFLTLCNNKIQIHACEIVQPAILIDSVSTVSNFM